jgi:hypothetical protein
MVSCKKCRRFHFFKKSDLLVRHGGVVASTLMSVIL